MKKLMLLPMILIFIACWGEGSLIDDGVDAPVDSNTVMRSNAHEVMSFENTATSVVKYFFASQIRRDALYDQVCVSMYDRSVEMNVLIETFKRDGIYEYKFLENDCTNDNCIVSASLIYYESGVSKEGVFDLNVKKIEDHWLIADITKSK